jgi:DNA repair photolyase
MAHDKYSPDQPRVPGADVIYRPAGNAGEYAPLATNPYSGCSHGCKYCYVPLATKIDRKVFDTAAVPRAGFIDRLRSDVRRYRKAGICDGHHADQVFITFSSDPYHPGNLTQTARTIVALIQGGMSFCTLSKGGTRALEFLDFYRPERDAYAATLTTLDDRFSRKWERNAPLPADRIEALREFHHRGIFTWVSLEPTLDVDASLEIVRATHQFVDLYKIGRANYLKEITKTTDWRAYCLRMIDVLQRYGSAHYIKRDLQEFLPVGYSNSLRISQHH